MAHHSVAFCALLLICPLSQSQQPQSPVPPMPVSKGCPLQFRAVHWRFNKDDGPDGLPHQTYILWKPLDRHGGVVMYSGVYHGPSADPHDTAMLHRPKASDSAEAFRNIQSFKRQFGDEHPQVLTSGGDWMYLLKSVDWVEIDKIRFKNGDEWSASDGMICAFPAEQLLCSTGPPKCNHDPVR